ncbi:MAG: T9SS type A sorting domain-containing protein [bacterium]|nr:T9SS type A sorting domain-containing protein [bacterium]
MSAPQYTAAVLLVLAVLLLPCAVQAQDAETRARHVSLAPPQMRDDGTVVTAVRIDDATDLIAGDVDLSFAAAGTRIVDVRASDLLRGFFLLSNVVADTLRVSFAGGSATQGQGTLFEIISEGAAMPGFSLFMVSLNGDQIPVAFDPATAVRDGDPELAAADLRAYPNPFNADTIISFVVMRPSVVQLVIFAATGQRVRVLPWGTFAAGVHYIRWDGTDASGTAVASGMYFARLQVGVRRSVVRLALLR